MKLTNLISSFVDRLKKEIKDRRSDVSFLIAFSFLISFTLTNLWVALFEAKDPVSNEVSYSIGENLVLGGFHIHHITYGVLLVILSSWLTLKYRGKLIIRISAVFHGLGLGLIVDEMGFIIDGLRDYNDKYWFYAAAVIVAALVAIISVKPFYKNLDTFMEQLREEERR